MQYPLTLEGGASVTSDYAKSVVAGEFIQHYCNLAAFGHCDWRILETVFWISKLNARLRSFSAEAEGPPRSQQRDRTSLRLGLNF